MIIFACSKSKINRRNFARAYLLLIGISTVLCIIYGAFIYNSANKVTDEAINSMDALYNQMENNNY